MTIQSTPFAIVPIEVASDSRLSKEQLRVLLALLSFRDADTNLFWPQRQAVSERCGLPLKKISEATTALVALGWLEKEGNGGRGLGCHYRFLVPSATTLTVTDSGTVEKPVTVPHSVTVTDSVTVPHSGTKRSPIRGRHSKERTDQEQTSNNSPLSPPTARRISLAEGAPTTHLGTTPRHETPDGLDVAAWNRYATYRVEIRKPIKPASLSAAQRKLAGFGPDQADVVEQSIANGWQGLFPLKDKKNESNQQFRQDSRQQHRDARDRIEANFERAFSVNGHATGPCSGRVFTPDGQRVSRILDS